MFSLTRQPISAFDSENPAAGARAVFEGIARNENGGRAVARLEYEAFDELAIREGEAILEEARRRFALLAARCAHRLGALEIGETAVRVEVLAGHRGEAFAACAWIIDEVKRRVPIWKKEWYADGDSGWVGTDAAASGGIEVHP